MINGNELCSQIKNLFKIHTEWLLIHQSGKTFALQTNELEIEENRNRIFLGFLDEKGFQIWRVAEAGIKNEKVSFKLTRNFEKEEIHIEIIPRVRAEDLGGSVELARLEKCNQIANLIVEETAGIRLERVELNNENGRFAEIILEQRSGKQIAAVADVSDSLAPEILLSSMVLRLRDLQRRKKNRVTEGWLISEKKNYSDLRKLHACLREKWKQKIKIRKISPRTSKGSGKELFGESKALSVNDLWRAGAGKVKFERNRKLSGISREIIRLAPARIDHLFTGKGETLRYLGQPFVRVRRIFGEEKAWFGIGREQRILDESTYEDFYEMFQALEYYRKPDSPNKQHLFYKNSSEAWLESIFRRNIKLLDANLVLSPIYNQFRTAQDKIDLLALRRDGRLIIIELKVSPDREMIYQAVDYWRKIEHRRRKGIFKRENIFGDLEIADRPAIIYLVAPTLSFHRDLNFLAQTIAPEIEIIRFDLAENWREDPRVLGRRKVGDSLIIEH